jgi:hypothetical protein
MSHHFLYRSLPYSPFKAILQTSKPPNTKTLALYTLRKLITASQLTHFLLLLDNDTHLTMSRTRSNSYIERFNFARKNVEEFPQSLLDIASFECIIGNEPIFTRELLETAAKSVDEARNSATCHETIVIPHVLGGDARMIQGSAAPYGKNLRFTSSWCMFEVDGKSSPYSIVEERDPTAVTSQHTLEPGDGSHPLRQQIMQMRTTVDEQLQLKAMEAKLLSGSTWMELQKLLLKLPAKVDNIVTIALGSPFKNDQFDKLCPRTCEQHLMASAVSTFLPQYYASDAPIPIVAYDPAYNVEALRVLSDLPSPITVVSQPYQYLSMSPNSLVFCVGVPSFTPVIEIVADLMFPSGPLAMLCNELWEQPWHAQGQNTVLEHRVPRVSKMLDLYDEPLWHGESVDRSDVESGWLWSMVWYARKE